MPKQRSGRPNVLGKGAGYLTIKFTAEQLRAINRFACPGGRPAVYPRCIGRSAEACKAACDAMKPTTIPCACCGAPFETRHAGRVYCSRACSNRAAQERRQAPVVHVICLHCSNPIEHPGGRRKFCRPACRKARHMAQFAGELDAEGEIPVVDIDEAPRRLAVAKLFDRFEGGDAFPHVTPPQWVNPADRRHWR